MHRLTILEHHIIGDINDIIDRSNAICAQTVTKPLGGRCNLNIFNDSGCVTITKLLGRNFYIQHIIHRTCIAAIYNRLVVFHRHTKSSSRLSSKTDNRITIGPVVGNFKLNNSVVITNYNINIVSGLTIFFNNPNAIFDRIGEVAQGQI